MKFARLSSKLKWILALTCGLILASPLVWWKVRRLHAVQRIYRIGFSNQPPQHFPGKDGKPTGLVVELINEAARRRGIRLQWSMEPESSEAALKMNKVDLWPIMTIRPERKGVVYIYRSLPRRYDLPSCAQYKRVHSLARPRGCPDRI
jgi:ABC-type amino acid transport substrate-binding protein